MGKHLMSSGKKKKQKNMEDIMERYLTSIKKLTNNTHGLSLALLVRFQILKDLLPMELHQDFGFTESIYAQLIIMIYSKIIRSPVLNVPTHSSLGSA